MLIWIIVIVVVVAVVGFGVVGFNRLRSADVGAEEALGGIDVQLTRRADLIPNLVETVKGYAAHEKSVVQNVTAARARVQQAASGSDVKAKAEADAALQGALINLNAENLRTDGVNRVEKLKVVGDYVYVGGAITHLLGGPNMRPAVAQNMGRASVTDGTPSGFAKPTRKYGERYQEAAE